MGATHELFGTERLHAELVACSSELLSDALRRVLRAVECWPATDGPQDDISVVAVAVDRS